MEPATKQRPVMDIQPRASLAPAPHSPAPAMPESPQPNIPELPDDHHELQPTPRDFPAALPKARRPVGVIAIALLVGASFIGLTLFGYMKSQDKAAEVAKPATTTTPAVVTVDDVDESLTSADAVLKQLDDAADFSASSFSDDSLGL
jgi:hypothetical protein